MMPPSREMGREERCVFDPSKEKSLHSFAKCAQALPWEGTQHSGICRPNAKDISYEISREM